MSVIPKRLARMGQHLKEQGFDDSTYDCGDRTYRVRCSQCEALVINGVPTHERGCPNQPRDEDED